MEKKLWSALFNVFTKLSFLNCLTVSYFLVNGPSTPVVCTCIAIYDYTATREDELTIHEGWN